MKSPKKYTAAERQAAIRHALDVGNAAASRELAIPTGTLSCWCHKARQGVAARPEHSVMPAGTAP